MALVPETANLGANEEQKGAKSNSHEKVVAGHDDAIAAHPVRRENDDLATSSNYNIYFRKDEKKHFIITPLVSPEREKFYHKAKQVRNLDRTNYFTDGIPREAADNSYYVHAPYLSFHHPPRTLRHGSFKTSPTVCLVNNSWFWRKWILQFGEQLSRDGVIDPRGVVSAQYGADKKDPKGWGVKGYKVRTWRLWGESGKAYHKSVNEERKAGIPDHPVEGQKESKPLIDEVIYFAWQSPFTHKTRHYRFRYAGLDFYWKGTGTVKESKSCGFFLRFHHIKLMVRIPIEEEAKAPIRRTTTWGPLLKRVSTNGPGRYQEVCIAKYTSALASRKAGVLNIYDDAIYRLMMEDTIPLDPGKKKELEAAGVIGVKRLRLYDVIVATGMCMVIGEWQKRQWLKAIISTLIQGGLGAAG